MGVCAFVDELTEIAPGPVAGGARRTRHLVVRVRLAPEYERGGDHLLANGQAAGRLRSVRVTPEFDGSCFVVWNGDRRAPRLRVLAPDGVEHDDGEDHTGFLRDVELLFVE